MWPLAPVIRICTSIQPECDAVPTRPRRGAKLLRFAPEPITDADRELVVTRFTWANAVSAARLIIIIPSVAAIAHDEWRIASLWFAIAVITDVFDGKIARRRDEVSAFGGLLDHASDALFVTATLAALALLDLVPVLLPVLAIVSFAQYVWDSNALAGAPLRASVLGRWNGIGYYALAGVVVISHALELRWPSIAFYWAGQALVVTTLISMADRGYALWRIRRH